MREQSHLGGAGERKCEGFNDIFPPRKMSIYMPERCKVHIYTFASVFPRHCCFDITIINLLKALSLSGMQVRGICIATETNAHPHMQMVVVNIPMYVHM